MGRSLQKVGVRAYADVLSAEQTPVSVTFGNPNLLSNTEIRWHLQLRVLPESEPPFDASVHALLPQLSHPRPGTRVAVLYDPKGKIPTQYEIMGMPSSVLIGRDGKVIAQHTSFRESEAAGLEAQIRDAVAAKP